MTRGITLESPIYRSMDGSDFDSDLRLDLARAICEWLLDMTEDFVARGDLEHAFGCCRLAARILSKQNRELVSSRLEGVILAIASRVEEVGRNEPSSEHQGKVCLHVLTRALPYGGHTAMAIRWMQNDSSERTHSAIVLQQTSAIPDKLTAAVEVKGGRVYSAGPNWEASQVCGWLRRLAHNIADVVVLHIDVDDVVAAAAFGVEGGPPVLIVNHSAHIFWAGASVADLVINCRGSELEHFWTRHYRGLNRCATLPIPLNLSGSGDSTDFDELRRQTRRDLGIPEDAFVILTVGDTYKYTPLRDMDFPEVSRQILRRLPGAWLVVVGVDPNPTWDALARTCGNRLKVVGRQRDVAQFHAIADLYIEGFPFGSTTALLEAGAKGIPAVLAPQQCPPPYATDGVALDGLLVRPANASEYVQMVADLSTDVRKRAELGANLAASICQHHTGQGWQEYLEAALDSLPAQHRTYKAKQCNRTPPEIYDMWTKFVDQAWADPRSERLVEYAMGRIFAMGLRRRPSGAVWDACNQARAVRRAATVPLPLLKTAAWLSSGVPTSWAHGIVNALTKRCVAGSKTISALRLFLPDRFLW